ncbi:MAG: hypothetical protein ACOY4H_06250 [Thermodesulfobacteriota bacterium]
MTTFRHTPLWYRLLNHLNCGLNRLFGFESERPLLLLLWGTHAGLFFAFWLAGEAFFPGLVVTLLIGWPLVLALLFLFLSFCLVIAVLNGLFGRSIGWIARRNRWQRRELRPAPVCLPPVLQDNAAARISGSNKRSDFWTGVLVGVGLAFLIGGT